MSAYVPMTDDEISQIGIMTSSNGEFAKATEQAVLARIEAQGLVIVPVADCPNCTNVGGYFDNYGLLHQCQWCYEMPHSRFNQQQAMLEATKEST